MRAFRPGPMGGSEFEDEFDQHREEKLVVYAERANAGLPLFDAAAASVELSASEFFMVSEGGAIAF